MQSDQPLRSRIRVLVADSSLITSQLLAEAIARDPRIEVMGFTSYPPEIVRYVRSGHPNILLMSARLEEEPNRGLELLELLRTEHIAPRTVALLDSRRPDVIVNAFRAGASGVFCRSGSFDLLCKCIAAVHEGQIWANSDELGFVLAALSALPRFDPLKSGALALLSKREREVIQSVVEGQTNRQIAETLGISQHTVKNYMFKIFDKLGVSNRTELVFHVLSTTEGSSHTRDEVPTNSSPQQQKEQQKFQGTQISAQFTQARKPLGRYEGAVENRQSRAAGAAWP